MTLAGKNRDEIERALSNKTRSELIDLIHSLVTVEQHYKPAAIAKRSTVTTRAVLAEIHAGKFGGEYYKRADNHITVSASGVNSWRKNFRILVGSYHDDSSAKQT